MFEHLFQDQRHSVPAQFIEATTDTVREREKNILFNCNSNRTNTSLATFRANEYLSLEPGLTKYHYMTVTIWLEMLQTEALIFLSLHLVYSVPSCPSGSVSGCHRSVSGWPFSLWSAITIQKQQQESKYNINNIVVWKFEMGTILINCFYQIIDKASVSFQHSTLSRQLFCLDIKTQRWHQNKTIRKPQTQYFLKTPQTLLTHQWTFCYKLLWPTNVYYKLYWRSLRFQTGGIFDKCVENPTSRIFSCDGMMEP